MQELAQLISNIGFPIVICLFLLIRLEPKISDLTEAITGLKEVVSNCNQTRTKERRVRVRRFL